MPRYRRSLTGTTYFFTVVTLRRRPILCDDPIRAALRDAIERVRARLPFTTDAMVLMPDHLHCIWTLPDGDTDFSSGNIGSGTNAIWSVMSTTSISTP